MNVVRWHWRKKDGRIVAVTLASREAMFVDDDMEAREVSIVLVIGVGTGDAVAAGDVF
jgi:hypothetical protein